MAATIETVIITGIKISAGLGRSKNTVVPWAWPQAGVMIWTDGFRKATYFFVKVPSGVGPRAMVRFYRSCRGVMFRVVFGWNGWYSPPNFETEGIQLRSKILNLLVVVSGITGSVNWLEPM